MNAPARVGLVLVLLITSACGGGAPSSPSPAAPAPSQPTPAPTVQEVSFPGTVPAFGTASHELTVTVGGTMTASLSWADAAVDLDLYLTDTTCSGYPPLDCTVLVRAISDTGLSEQVARAVKVGEKYSLWVDNLAPNRSVAYTLHVVVR